MFINKQIDKNESNNLAKPNMKKRQEQQPNVQWNNNDNYCKSNKYYNEGDTQLSR